MSNQIRTHSFEGGMDKDTSAFKYPTNKYSEARGLRLTVDEDLHQFSLTTVKGNTAKFHTSGFYHGHCFIRERLILFIREDLYGNDAIFDIDPLNPPYYSGTLLDFNAHVFSGDLSFTEGNLVSAVGSYEGSDLRKVYWTDGITPMRFINLENDYTGYVADDFNIIPPSDHESYTLTEIKESGSLTAGIVQYTYKLYNKNGGETYFAPLSSPYNITKGSLTNLSEFINHKGGIIEEDCNRAFKFEITNNVDIDKFTYIQVVGVYYESAEIAPIVKVIGDYEFNSNTIEFFDSGTGYTDTYSAEEFIALRNIFTAGSLKEKNNYLFAADITEQTFDIDFDCRSYRFNDTGRAKLLESDDSYYVIFASGVVRYNELGNGPGGGATLGDWAYFSDVGIHVTNHQDYDENGYGTDWSIPATADCICPNNYIENDFSADGASGTDDTSSSAAFLTDTTQSWTTNQFAGGVIYNLTDPDASGVIVSNTNQTVTATLSGGATNLWNNLDEYEIDMSLTWFEYKYTADGWSGTTKSYGASGKSTEISINMQRFTADIYNNSNFSPPSGFSNNSSSYKEGKNQIYQYQDGASSPYTTMEHTSNPAFLNGYNNLINPSIAAKYKSWRRDEIYRLGIVFVDNFGRDSYTKWTNDFRMPRTFDDRGILDNFKLFTVSNDIIYLNGLYLNFELTYSSEFSDNNIIGYRVVAVKRDLFNSTILDNGIVGSLEELQASSGFYNNSGWAFPTSVTNSAFIKNGQNYNNNGAAVFTSSKTYTHIKYIEDTVKEYISPDINFNTTDVSTTPDKFVAYSELTPHISAHGLADSGSNTYQVGNFKKYDTIRTEGKGAYCEYNITDFSIFSDTSYNSVDANTVYSKTVNGQKVLNYSKGARSAESEARGTCGIAAGTVGAVAGGINKFEAYTPTNDYDDCYQHEALYVARKQIIEPYGGLSYESRLTNEYEECSETKYFKGETQEVICYGDTYLSFFEHIRTMIPVNDRDVDDNSNIEVLYIPIESSFMNDFRTDTPIYRIHDTIFPNYSILGFHEIPGVYDIGLDGALSDLTYEQDFYLYDFNLAYTRNNWIKTYYPAPIGYVFNESYRYDTKIIASEQKSNRELIDSWTKFLFANEMELKTEFGPITNLDLITDTLIAIQERAIAQVAVNEREQITGQTGVALTLGTGGILERYDYVNTTYGCQSKFGHIVTPTGLYFYDKLNNSIFALGAQGEPSLDKIKFMDAYFKDNKNDTFDIQAVGYDRAHNDILFTFNLESGGQETLVVNDLANMFTHFLDTNRHHYIWDNNIFLPLTNQDDFGVAVNGITWVDDDTSTTLEDVDIENVLKIITRPETPEPARYDIIEWNSIVKNLTTGVDEMGTTFDSIQGINTYQDTGVIGDSRFLHKFRTWRLNQLRDNTTVRGNLHPRLRSDWLELIFKFTPKRNKLWIDTIKVHHQVSTK